MSDPYKHPKWQKKRLQILERDGWKCVACKDADSTLHVHHIVYEGNPWDVDDRFMQTLCESCHSYLGEHPKGGVYWLHCAEDGHAVVHIAWCPKCRSQKFRDKGAYFQCDRCRWRTSIYESGCNLCEHIALIVGEQKEESSKPAQQNTSFLVKICEKLRSAGVTNIELFRVVFDGLPVPEAVLRSQRADDISERLKSGSLSTEDEAALLESLVALRRDQPRHRATLGTRKRGAK